MAAQVAGCNNACEKFPINDVNFGVKYMSDIMASGEGWAKAILEADRAPVPHARTLNPANGRNNTYGALRLGLAVQNRGWQAKDPSVHKTLNQWIQNLNGIMPARAKYEPDQLPQLATDLSAAADCIAKQSGVLLQRAEITPTDHGYLKQITEGLEGLAKNLRDLHEKVKQGPGICEVHLDIVPQQH